MTTTETSTRWRVDRDPAGELFRALAGPWRVTSPRGVELFRTPTQRQSFELAYRFAAVDSILAGLNAVAAEFTSLAAELGTPPAPPAPARPALALVEDGEQ